MRFAVLGSGSKGNALVVHGGGRTVLVDCGYGPREIKRRLEALDVDVKKLDAILLTHGHGDHAKGARQLAGALGIPTYATEQTKLFLQGYSSLRNHIPIPVNNTAFMIGGLSVLAVRTPHDCPGSVCFVVDDGEERIGYATDLGFPSPRVAQAFSTCDALVLEHNYDPEMLRTGPYPWHLKRRVSSTKGHLSNAQGAELLQLAMHPGLTRVLLAHVSETNNTHALALAAARPVVDGRDIELSVAPQYHPTGWLRARRQRTLRPELSRHVEVSEPPRPAPLVPVPKRHRALDAQLSLFAATTATATTTSA